MKYQNTPSLHRFFCITLMTASSALLASQRVVAQSLLVSDHDSQVIYKYDLQAKNKRTKFATVPTPYEVIADLDNNILVATGELGHSVERFNGATGEKLGSFVAPGSGGLQIPTGMTYGPDHNLYVTSSGNGSILRYDGKTGQFLNIFVATGSGGLSTPNGLAFGRDGNLYVTDFVKNSIFRYDGKTGEPLGVFASGHGLDSPRTLTFGPDNNLYVGNGFFGREPDSTVKTHVVMRFNGTTGTYMDTVIANHTGGSEVTGGITFGESHTLYMVSESRHLILSCRSPLDEYLKVIGSTKGNCYGILYRPATSSNPSPPSPGVNRNSKSTPPTQLQKQHN